MILATAGMLALLAAGVFFAFTAATYSSCAIVVATIEESDWVFFCGDNTALGTRLGVGNFFPFCAHLIFFVYYFGMNIIRFPLRATRTNNEKNGRFS
jgi:hypothetical protein